MEQWLITVYLIVQIFQEVYYTIIDSKKEERFKNTLDIYYKLVDNFPQSRYLRDAEKIFEAAKAELKKMDAPVKNS